MTDFKEQCLKCRWLAPQLNPPCGRIFKFHFTVNPLGGDIKIDFIPGMIPEQFEEKFKEHLAKACEWIAAVIQKDPLWDEIAAEMQINPAKSSCPGRDELNNEFVRVVRH